MNYIYGWAWHEQGRFPVEGLDEAQAKKKWAKGPQVSVSAGEDLVEGKVPAYTLSMSARAEAVDVYLYDAEGSVVSVLGWRSVDERLFLTDVIEYLYPEDGDLHEQDECLANRQYLFKPDGYARLRSSVTAAGADTVEEFADVDVSDHWLDPLGWGDWDRIGGYRPSAGSLG